jgi:hypothetical protein
MQDSEATAPLTKGRVGAKKGRKPKRRQEEYVSHVIRVRDWDFYYSRRATDPKSKWNHRPFDEITTLSFIGQVVRPDKCKFKEGKLTFSGQADFDERERSTSFAPIGSAMARGEEIEGYLFVPEERIRLLLTAAQSGRVEMVQFTGSKLRYGSSRIHSVSVVTHFDEDEW